MCASGLCFSVLNATIRLLTQSVDPFQAQFLRYLLGLVVLLPFMLIYGRAWWWPLNVATHFKRGALHAAGLAFWFTALPHISLAATTAIGFTTPIFVLLGAALFFSEPMRWERWAATLAGFAGVLIVVGPQVADSPNGLWYLVMLCSAPLFAASFLLTKSLTRHESASAILVWQSISVSVFSLVPALWHWQPIDATQWLLFALCGALGSTGHYCLTRGFAAADISATQPARFLDLLWSTLMGFAIFGDVPAAATLIGGTLIAAATVWLARRESHHARRSQAQPVALDAGD